MKGYDCIHRVNISKYKCPKCEAGYFLTDEEIREIASDTFTQPSMQDINFAKKILAKAKEILKKASEK